MAFSYSIKGQTYNGPSHRTLWGTWTGSSGDSAGTVPIAGTIMSAVFQKMDTKDNTYQIIPRVEVSMTSGISTITVENQDDVTDGKFIIEVLGN